ncbi:hypothetical protein AB0I81_62820 [Nonomuraea sp. NPDC050404]
MKKLLVDGLITTIHTVATRSLGGGDGDEGREVVGPAFVPPV